MKKLSISIFLLICFLSVIIQCEEKKEEKCGPGLYKSENGCASCPQGTYNPTEDGSCIDCPTGQYSTIASAHCELCGAGTEGAGPGRGCRWCPINHFNPTRGGGKCRPCPKGSQANSSRSDCENFFDFGIYHEDYILPSEQNASGWNKATMSNFRQFFKFLNYDSKISDFSSVISKISGKDAKENLEGFKDFLTTEQVSLLLGQRLQPEILNLFDKAIHRLPDFSQKEMKEFLGSLKIWGGVSEVLGKACSVVGFVAGISQNMMDNIKNKESIRKFTNDFITDSTMFFYTEALGTTIATGIITAGALEVAVGGIIIGYGINYMVENLKVFGKTPEQYYRTFIEELTNGIGEDAPSKLQYIQ